METLDYGRVGISAAAVGGARKAVELATAYAVQRSQFGTSIANKQAIQMYLADAATQVQAGQWLVRHAAWLADQGQPFTQEAAMAKLYCGRMAGEVTNKMLQVHGGAGFIADYPIERYYRDARAHGACRRHVTDAADRHRRQPARPRRRQGEADTQHESKPDVVLRTFVLTCREGRMDFTLPKNLQLFKEMLREFAEQEVRPYAKKVDAQGWPDMDVIRKLGENGLLGRPLPDEVRRRRAWARWLLPADGNDGRHVHLHRHPDRRPHRHRRDGIVPGRQRGTEEEVPARPVQRPQDRRVLPHRARRRV